MNISLAPKVTLWDSGDIEQMKIDFININNKLFLDFQNNKYKLNYPKFIPTNFITLKNKVLLELNKYHRTILENLAKQEFIKRENEENELLKKQEKQLKNDIIIVKKELKLKIENHKKNLIDLQNKNSLFSDVYLGISQKNKETIYI